MAKKILLADDEMDIKTIVEMFLESQGYEVATAYDGLDALDKVKTENPDLILLDVMMPMIDGFEVAKRLKADPETKNIPIIMLSAAGQKEAVQRGLDAGAIDYIVKPFEPVELGNKIEKYLKED